MGSIQLVLSDMAKQDALRTLLVRSTPVPVRCVESPDFESACVVVMDGLNFGTRLSQIIHPDRVVLITRNDPGSLREAWEAGINSVLSEQDSLNTVVLAVLATCLRSGTARTRVAGPD